MNNCSTPVRRRSTAGAVSKSLLSFLVSLLVSLVMLEIGLRIFTSHPINFTSGQVEHPQLMYTMNPALEYIDENGFRNRSTAPVDIVAIGDSHTYGWNVAWNEAWPKIVGERLGVNVYNMGMGGYDLLQYQYLLEKSLSLDPKPKIVLLALYLPNDLQGMCELLDWNQYWKAWAKTNDVDSSVCPKVQDPENFLFVLRTRLAVASIINDLYARTRGIRDFSGVKANAVKISTDSISTTVRFSYLKSEFMDLRQRRIAVAFDILKKLLADSQVRATTEGIFMGVLMLPSKARVVAGFIPALPSEIAQMYREAALFEDQLTENLARFMTLKGIAYRDLRPDMEAAVASTKDIYPRSFDDHPTAIGQGVYADAAYKLMASHGWLGGLNKAPPEK